MTHTSLKLAAVFAITLAALVTVMAPPVAWAQASGMSAKPLLRTSLSDDTSKDTVMLAVEIAAGGTTGRHFHHGDEYAFVLQGTLELVAEGRETRRITAGDAFHNPRGLIHEAKNAGDTPVRLHIVFVVDKGKPIIEPVAKRVGHSARVAVATRNHGGNGLDLATRSPRNTPTMKALWSSAGSD